MPRFFVKPQNINSEYIKIVGDDVQHIKNVLRLKIGEKLVLCDNINDYEVEIYSYEADCVNTRILDTKKSSTEANIDITLFQGLPKSDKMDFIVQKSVELGVKEIIPIITSRTIVKLGNNKDINKKITRWQRISLEASKQCNRGIIPSIGNPISFEQSIIRMKDFDLSIIPYEKEDNTGIKKIIGNKDLNIKKIAIIIGPEGGFSLDEVKFAEKFGVISVKLGPRILRTETAGLATISVIMYELGDIGK